MGADYSAYAIIGVKIDKAKLTTLQKVKAFAHNRPETMKFDPDTGQALWAVNEIPISGYDEDNQTLFDYDLILGTDGEPAIVSYLSIGKDTYSNGGGDSQRMELPNDLDIKKIKFEMKANLPFELWDEKQFGLWSILYCSY